MTSKEISSQFNQEYIDFNWHDDIYWDVIYPIYIDIYGVQANPMVTYTCYEAVVFDNISDSDCEEVLLMSDDLEIIKRPIFDFEKVTDTLVKFRMEAYFSPDIYDFRLRMIPKKWKKSTERFTLITQSGV